MKIIHFLGGLDIGGAENLIKDYAIELKKRGHEILIPVIYSNPTSSIQIELEKQNIEIKVFKGIYKKSFFSRLFNKFVSYFYPISSHLKNLINNFKPDIIHFHGYSLTYLLLEENIIKNSMFFFFNFTQRF
jgi:hypothetical protein